MCSVDLDHICLSPFSGRLGGRGAEDIPGINVTLYASGFAVISARESLKSAKRSPGLRVRTHRRSAGKTAHLSTSSTCIESWRLDTSTRSQYRWPVTGEAQERVPPAGSSRRLPQSWKLLSGCNRPDRRRDVSLPMPQRRASNAYLQSYEYFAVGKA